jgi:hypothetical protein
MVDALAVQVERRHRKACVCKLHVGFGCRFYHILVDLDFGDVGIGGNDFCGWLFLGPGSLSSSSRKGKANRDKWEWLLPWLTRSCSGGKSQDFECDAVMGSQAVSVATNKTTSSAGYARRFWVCSRTRFPL